MRIELTFTYFQVTMAIEIYKCNMQFENSQKLNTRFFDYTTLIKYTEK